MFRRSAPRRRQLPLRKVRLGTNLAQVILDQRRETLDPEQSLTEVLTAGSGDTVTVGGHSRQTRRRRLPNALCPGSRTSLAVASRLEVVVDAPPLPLPRSLLPGFKCKELFGWLG
jgi:hypothetical protein